jgi:hypothetical protein
MYALLHRFSDLRVATDTSLFIGTEQRLPQTVVGCELSIITAANANGKKSSAEASVRGKRNSNRQIYMMRLLFARENAAAMSKHKCAGRAVVHGSCGKIYKRALHQRSAHKAPRLSAKTRWEFNVVIQTWWTFFYEHTGLKCSLLSQLQLFQGFGLNFWQVDLQNLSFNIFKNLSNLSNMA